MARMHLFCKGMTTELQKMAEKELNETPQIKEEALKEFRELIKEQHILCRMDDLYLLRYLRVKKFNVQKALKVLRNHINLYRKYPEFFSHRAPSEMKSIFDMQLLYFIPYRDDDFAYVTCLRVSGFDVSDGGFDKLTGYVSTWGDIVLEYEATQISGNHMILDLADLSFHQCRTILRFSYIKLLISILQDCFPLRVRGLHIVHNPFGTQAVYQLFKLFGTKKLTEKVHIYGNDVSGLQRFVPKDLLPPHLGGTMNPMDNEELASIFYSYEDMIVGMRKFAIGDKNA